MQKEAMYETIKMSHQISKMSGPSQIANATGLAVIFKNCMMAEIG